MNRNKTALVVIDVQNDYFPGGKFPQWNTEATLQCVERAIRAAKERDVPVVLVQHVADPAKGVAPFFNAGTPGVDIHQVVLKAAPDAPVVVKKFADAFAGTDLETVLDGLGVGRVLFCGMMTQNCVTHTAISPSAAKYETAILADCCTTVSDMLHRIALNALVTRPITLTTGIEAFAEACES